MNLVQEYGSKYLGNMDDLMEIADFIAKNKKESDGLVVVVDGMKEIVSEMESRKKELKDKIRKKEEKALMSIAQQQTATLMATALNQKGIPAEAVSDMMGEKLSLSERADEKKQLDMSKIDKLLSKGKVPVVAGFQGVGEQKTAENPIRECVAATAVAIAAGLGWECELYGEAKAIYTTDPKITKKKTPIREICYEEAMELALSGGIDIEARAMELAKTHGVKVYIGKGLVEEKSGGTYIMDRKLIVQEAAVTGIGFSDDIVIYTLKDVPTDGDSVAELFEMLGELNVNIDMISQQRYSDDTCAVSFSCNQNKVDEIDTAFEGNQRMRDFKVSKVEHLSIISIVGVGMATHNGIASRVFSTLAQNDIPHYNISTSEISISAAIDTKDRSMAVIKLSEEFSL